MPTSDYNKLKPLEVNSNGRSNVSSADAYAVKIVSGSNSTTGTGDIEIDDTNVDGKEDIAIYDGNDNLLDYYWEVFDTTGGKYVAWVQKSSLTRDNTVQAKVYFGNGSTDESTTVETVFDAVQGLTLRYAFDETSAPIIDSTSNNNDSTSTTGLNFNVDSQFNGGIEADGNDDEINTDNLSTSPGGNTTSMLAFHTGNISTGVQQRTMSTRDTGFNTFSFQWNNGSNDFRGDITNNDTNDADSITISHSGYTSSKTQLVVHQTNFSTRNHELFVYGPDGGENKTSSSYNFDHTSTDDLRLFDFGDVQYFDGVIDEFRYYNTFLSDARVNALWDMAPTAGQVLFSQQAAEDTQTVATIALPESSGIGITPNPQVNAGEATVNLPETTGLAQSPEPALFTDLFASMPVSTGNAASPNPTFAAGEATINLSESVGTAVSPNPSLFQANLIRAPPSVGTAVSPEPVIKGGLEEIALPVSTGTGTNPEPTIRFAQNLNLVASSGNAASPAPTFNTGATTISLPESTGTGFTPNPSVAVSVVPRDDSNTLSIRQSQSKTLSGDINK